MYSAHRHLQRLDVQTLVRKSGPQAGEGQKTPRRSARRAVIGRGRDNSTSVDGCAGCLVLHAREIGQTHGDSLAQDSTRRQQCTTAASLRAYREAQRCGPAGPCINLGTDGVFWGMQLREAAYHRFMPGRVLGSCGHHCRRPFCTARAGWLAGGQLDALLLAI